MKIELRTFASIKEIVGERISIEMPEKKSVDEVMNLLKLEFPEISEMIDSSRIATNETILEGQHLLNDKEELFLLPPSSGG